MLVLAPRRIPLAPVFAGFALALALAVGCSGLDPTPPNPHLNDPDPNPDPTADHLVTDTDAGDLDASDAAEDAP